MFYIASIGTYVPCRVWGTPYARAVDADEDVDEAEVHDFFTGIESISVKITDSPSGSGSYKLAESEVTTIVGGTVRGAWRRGSQ